jgi:hypothetical protein
MESRPRKSWNLDLYDDLAVLVESNIIKNPDYYLRTANPGGECEGSYVRILIKDFAEYVREKNKIIGGM